MKCCDKFINVELEYFVILWARNISSHDKVTIVIIWYTNVMILEKLFFNQITQCAIHKIWLKIESSFHDFAPRLNCFLLKDFKTNFNWYFETWQNRRNVQKFWQSFNGTEIDIFSSVEWECCGCDHWRRWQEIMAKLVAIHLVISLLTWLSLGEAAAPTSTPDGKILQEPSFN